MNEVEAAAERIEPSKVTNELCQLLRERDAKGRAKYGTTLDRTDLTPQQWIRHAVEELLDAAGYLTALSRTLDAEAEQRAMAVDEAWIETFAWLEGDDEHCVASYRVKDVPCGCALTCFRLVSLDGESWLAQVANSESDELVDWANAPAFPVITRGDVLDLLAALKIGGV